MNRRQFFTKLCVGLMALTLLCPTVNAADARPVRLSTAWMGEQETFIAWYAKEKGWDKEAGFELVMMPFDSGKNLVDSLSAYNWAIAGCGAVPALTTPLSEYLYIIAIGNDESNSNALYVRKNSPLLKVKGFNPAYPDVYGSPDTVRGKQILYPEATSAHYLLDNWLQILGLSQKDVALKNMEPTPALSAFTGGEGDGVALWAPLTFEAESKGFSIAATSRACKVTQPVVLVANRDFADKHPEQVKAFLKMYFRGIDLIRQTPPEQLATDYIRFYKEWAQYTLTPEMAVADLQHHPVFTFEEQLQMFDTTQGKSKLQNWLCNIIDFYGRTNHLSPGVMMKMKDLDSVTDKFMKSIK